MSQQNNGPDKGFPCGIAIPIHSRVIMAGTPPVLAIAGATDLELGCVDQTTFVPNFGGPLVTVPVRLKTAQGTEKMIANGAITQYAVVYAAASGKVSATGTRPIGIALEAAAADGDTIEILRGAPAPAPVGGVAAGYKIARGQLTTASAADTVVTGLATVVSVVASMESDPVLTADLVTAQVGDQAGAPVAGSVIIKTWEPTDSTHTTMIAATTFGKKVNWIAVGT